MSSNKNLTKTDNKIVKYQFLCEINIDSLNYQIKDNKDTMMITETKLDESFLIGQFFINVFSSPFCLDRDRNSGGILLYIKEDVPSKLLAIENITETFFLEVNLHKKKWLISCSYNPNKALIANYRTILSKNIDIYTTKYGNLLFCGDFNAGLEDTFIKTNYLASKE